MLQVHLCGLFVTSLNSIVIHCFYTGSKALKLIQPFIPSNLQSRHSPKKNVTSQFPYCRPGGPVSHFDLSTLTNYLLSASAIRHSYGNLLQTRAEIREYQNLFVPNESMTHRLSAIPFATSRRHLLFFVYFISCLGLPWLFPESGWPLLCSC